MAEVDRARVAAAARAIAEAAEPARMLTRTAAVRDSGRTRTVAPAIARVLRGRDWRRQLARRLEADVKYAVWRAVTQEVPEEALVRAEAALARTTRSERPRQEAAIGRVRRNPEQVVEAAERSRQRLAGREMADEEAEALVEELVRAATTILDSAYPAEEAEQARRGEEAETCMATEWFVTVHGGDAERAAENAEMTGMAIEDVFRIAVAGVSRQATDHAHEVVFTDVPVSGVSVARWTAARYMVARRDVNAQPARNVAAAVRYIVRQSTEMLELLAVERDGERKLVSRKWSGRIPEAERVRTYPVVGFEAYSRSREGAVSYTPILDERTQAMYRRATEAGRRRDAARRAPMALVFSPEAVVPASSYAVDMEALSVDTALFLTRHGTDAVAVEMERDTALAVHAGAAPPAMAVYAEREGAALTDTLRPREDAGSAEVMLRQQAGIVAQMARGHTEEGGGAAGRRAAGRREEGGAGGRGAERTAEMATAGEMMQQAETEMLRRAAGAEIERRAQRMDAPVMAERAPQYLRNSEQAGGRERGERRQATQRKEAEILFDATGALERDATETFGVAGIFFMVGSEATRHEGQPVVVIDRDQALRYRRHAGELSRRGAARHIFRGSRQEYEEAVARLSSRETPVSVSGYPVV